MIMASKHFHSRVRSVIYSLMAFLLSLVLFALSFCITLEATVLNPDFIINNMNSSSYFVDKRDEITRSLIDLGNASGLKEEFFEGFLDELMINEDTCNYLENYYSGEGKQIDTTQFKQSFNTALDKYIEDNKIESVNGESRENLVRRAALIYSSSLEIPLFSRLSAYFISLKNIMPYIIAGVAFLGLVICAVIIFTNKWKHRAVRYLCYAFSTAFISVGIVPTVVLLSGKISKINLTSRALYNLFVQCSNSVFVALLFCAIFFLLIALCLFFAYRSLYKKVNR